MTWLSVYSIFLDKLELKTLREYHNLPIAHCTKTCAKTSLQQIELNPFPVHIRLYYCLSYSLSSYVCTVLTLHSVHFNRTLFIFFNLMDCRLLNSYHIYVSGQRRHFLPKPRLELII